MAVRRRTPGKLLSNCCDRAKVVSARNLFWRLYDCPKEGAWSSPPPLVLLAHTLFTKSAYRYVFGASKMELVYTQSFSRWRLNVEKQD